jgi:catechol 2,3-dioxygenase-like lactoylglutathione lyase family enzyme
MDTSLTRLFSDFDEGRITRRELLQALAVAGLAVPAASFAQVRAGGAGGAGATPPAAGGGGGRAARDTTPAPPPFQATGWKTVWLDHFSFQSSDYKKATAFYSTLMGWPIRSDDGKQAVLDLGDAAGGVIMRGGFPAPPPPPPRAAGDTTPAGRGGGRGNARTAIWDGMCWGIDPWDAKKVEAALTMRGLNPVADNSGKDFESFHIKDPDGFALQISNGNKANRRKGAANVKLPAPAPFDAAPWKTIWIDHISYQVADYKKSVAFYQALLGWKPGKDGGTQNQCDIGDIAGIIIRNGRGGGGRGAGAGAGAPPAPVVTSQIDHISFGVSPWDPDKVEAELMKRGLGSPDRNRPGHLSPDTGGGGEIHTSPFQSYHTPDPFGWDLQISNITFATRDA